MVLMSYLLLFLILLFSIIAVIQLKIMYNTHKICIIHGRIIDQQQQLLEQQRNILNVWKSCLPTKKENMHDVTGS